MKLISCHIENFGKLHDYSVCFTKGMNYFCAENGWGKSTFAAFVRAMFYGLEGERKRSIEENERKRYMPWQGGVFGGQLVFEIEGKEYEISRIFHDKDVNDEFELRDAKTNLISTDYSKRIGEEIFKINREAFLRTIFVGQNGCETAATDDINAKIGNLSENTNDLNNFDSAYARLTEIINGLNPGRVTGSIAKRKDEIGRLERMVQDGRGIAESLQSYQDYLHDEEASYEELKVRRNETGKLQARVSGMQSVLAKKSEWERLKGTLSAKKQEAVACKGKLPGEAPRLEDVRDKLLECGEMDKAYERMSMYHISDAEEALLSEWQVVFEKGVPEEAQIAAKVEEVGSYRRLLQEYSAEQMTSMEKRRLEELEPYFIQETENIASVVGRWNGRNAKKAALPSNQAALTALKASAMAQRPKMQISPLMIIGILLAVIGIVVVIVESIVIGCIFAGVGIILLVAGFLWGRKKAVNWQPEITPEMESLERTIEEDASFIETVDAEVAEYLMAHNRVFEEYVVSTTLQEIAAEAVEYASLKKKALQAENSSKAEELERLRQSVGFFLQGYGVQIREESFLDDLYTLKSNVVRYVQLRDRKLHFKEAEGAYQTAYDRISCFLAEYGYVPEKDFAGQLSQIREDVDEYRDAIKAWAEAKAALEAFEADTDVSLLDAAQIEENLPSLEELNRTIMQIAEEMESVQGRILSYNKALDDLQEKYDEWEECGVKLTELKALQAQEQTMYNHIFKARAKLALAKEAMTAKYADPILESFSKYYEMITGSVANKFHVDANTTVTVEEAGKQRDTNTLSTGYRDLVGICLRIALIDAMYQEEAPMIIMDDPFTNLDDKKILAGKEFLVKVAEKYQIVYFTCSEAR